MLGIPGEVIGTIVAAIVGGLFAVLGLIISKEQKTSEFRQAWIDALRADIASAIACGYAVEALSNVHSTQGTPSQFQLENDTYVRLNEAIGRIRLRVNPAEDGDTILSTIQAIEDFFNRNNTAPIASGTFVLMERQLISQAQVVLKREWDRVRAGELTYRIAKYTGVTMCLFGIVGLICLCVYAWLHPTPRQLPSPTAVQVQPGSRSSSP